MTDGATGPADHGAWDPGEDEDAALARLEDVLLATPENRALPDLDVILSRAKYPHELLRRDDRALKLLSEAIYTRPLSSRDEVAASRSHVELLTLEVEVLSARLRDPDADEDAVADARRRLNDIHHELERLRRQL